MAAITGNQIILKLGVDEATAKTVVCNEELSFSLSANVIERSTKCGQLKAVGNVSGEASFSGVAELSPSGTQISHEQLLTWVNSKQRLWFGQTNGSTYNREGWGYISSYSEDAKVDDFVSFTATISVDGAITA